MSATKFYVEKHVFPGQHIRHYAGATRHKDEDTQYLEAKQYTPLDNPEPRESDITIIGTCAVSFPKELYEPLWDDLLTHCEGRGLRIRSIWAVDKSDHGASGVLNENTQGDDPSFSDLSLDLLNMINLFRDHMTLPIVGIGHSMGATALLELVNIHPRLFASVVVIDPILGFSIEHIGAALVYGSSRRPDIWRSREEAEKAFTSARPIRAWDPRAIELYLDYGLRDTPTALHPEAGKVTLRTTKSFEAWNYARPWFDTPPSDTLNLPQNSRAKHPDANNHILDTRSFYRPEANYVWDMLPHINPSTLWVFPEGGPMSNPKDMNDKVSRTGTGSRGSGGERAGRVGKVIIRGGSHLVPFEKPDMCAKEISGWLATDLRAWEGRKKFERDNRDVKSIDKLALSDEWVRQAKQWFQRTMGSGKPKL